MAFAQQSSPVRIIGSLALGATRPDDPIYAAMRKGLRVRGYVEGRDFRIEHRTAEGRQERLPALAEGLVRLKADVIVTGNDEATRIAQQATSTIPIVALLYNHDPIASGFIRSFNHPGGNITGLTVRNSELAGKRLELLKEIMPNLARLAVFWDRPANDELEALKLAARTLTINLQIIDLKSPPDLTLCSRPRKPKKPMRL
jgi:putative tryptophan/tyrosine transport system substrate-binding protein